MNLYDELTPEEKAFHDALVSIADQYGPFDQGASSIWVGYKPESQNEDAAIGVKCANCSFHGEIEGSEELSCKILSYNVQPNAICRLAAIPDGYVNADNKTNDMEMSKSVWAGSLNPNKAYYFNNNIVD